MIKEVKMFEAKDGKLFKTEKGAENHNKKLESNEVMKELNMTKDEVSEKLAKVSEVNGTIAMLLRNEPDWSKWSTHQIKWIDEELMNSINIKETLYVKARELYGVNAGVEETVLFSEKGSKFTDPDLHTGEGYNKYKVVEVNDVNERTRKVIYEDFYTYEEVMEMKLAKRERLTEEEISTLVYEYEEVYKEEGEESRWSRNILSVIDLNGKLYAIDWDRGLTESQENSFYGQPYEVTMEEKEVTITETIIKRV